MDGAAQRRPSAKDSPLCPECTHLYDEFIGAIAEVIALQTASPHPAWPHAPESTYSESPQETAAHRRRQAKQSLILHIQEHIY